MSGFSDLLGFYVSPITSMAGPPTGPAGGDLSGTYPNPTVTGAPPTGAAGGDLAGTYPNPTIASLTLAELNTLVTDATLDDSGGSRPPSGAAGGDLSGTYPNPTIAHITDTANPHATDIGNLGSGTLAELNAAVTDATLDTSSASRPPSGAAGGALSGTYPNPTLTYSLDDAYNDGATITIDAGAVTLDADVADTTAAFAITREPASPVAAVGATITLGANATGAALGLTSAGDSTSISITTSSATKNIIDIPNADSLTTGGIVNLVSNASDGTFFRTLLNVYNSNTGAVLTTPLLVRQAAAFRAVRITQDAASSFIDFKGAVGANTTSPISSHPTPGSITHWAQVERNSTKMWLALYTNPSA